MHMVKQATHGPRNRVRHFLGNAIGIEPHALLHLLAPAFTGLALDHNPPGNTHHCGTSRYFLGNHRVGADLGARAHLEGA